MKTIFSLILVSMLIITVGKLNAATSAGEGKAKDSEKAAKTLEKDLMALHHVMNDSENGIPRSLIDKSEGIMIFPGDGMVAAGAFNGQGGRGIAMVRREDGYWSNPFIVSLGTGSLGFQTETQTSDIVLLIQDKNDIMEIEKTFITLGDDVEVAAGPVNKGSLQSNDITFGSDIYSYYGSNGIFTGVNLNGGILSYHK